MSNKISPLLHSQASLGAACTVTSPRQAHMQESVYSLQMVELLVRPAIQLGATKVHDHMLMRT